MCQYLHKNIINILFGANLSQIQSKSTLILVIHRIQISIYYEGLEKFKNFKKKLAVVQRFVFLSNHVGLNIMDFLYFGQSNLATPSVDNI